MLGIERMFTGKQPLDKYRIREKAYCIKDLKKRLEWLEGQLKPIDNGQDWYMLDIVKQLREESENKKKEVIVEVIKETNDLILLEGLRNKALSIDDATKAKFFLIDCKNGFNSTYQLEYFNQNEYSKKIDTMTKEVENGAKNNSDVIKPIPSGMGKYEFVELVCAMYEAQKLKQKGVLVKDFVQAMAKTLNVDITTNQYHDYCRKIANRKKDKTVYLDKLKLSIESKNKNK